VTEAHARACRHYENRAMFKPRGPDAELVAELADACTAALVALRTGTASLPEDRARALAYLDRLAAFKDLIIGMNVERLYGPSPAPRAAPLTAPSTAGIVQLGRPVTATGEYLIAREFGLLSAWRAWMRPGPALAGPYRPFR
jgi:hypothetical protein